MCERSPLFLPEAKSILNDLLKRTLELFDLFTHLIEHYRLNKYLLERTETHNYHQYTRLKPCQINNNIFSDLNKYLQRLSTSCRLTKSYLRSLYAARLLSSNDYIVIDDDIYHLIRLFKSRLNKLSHQFQKEKSIEIQQSDHIIHQRYHSQRQIHTSHTTDSFMFLPEISNNNNNNSQNLISSNEILISFQKISYLYQILLQKLYGIHFVRDSDILQPIVTNIIHLLLNITNKFQNPSN